MSRGRRYNGEAKLNKKKVFAVIIAIIVIIMFFWIINTLLSKDKELGKIDNINYFTSFSDNKYGIINSKGETVIEPSYTEMLIVPNSKKDVFLCVYDVNYTSGEYKTKALNSKNEEIFKDYEQVEVLDNYDINKNVSYDQNALRVKKNGKYGLINLDGKEILECKYDEIKTIKEIENSILIKENDKYGLVDSNGKIIVKPEYSDIKRLSLDYTKGYIVVNNEGKYGIIDCTNNIVLETKYEDIKPITGDNKYVVKENGKWKIVDKDSNTILENNFDTIEEINGDNVIIKKSNKYGVINIKSENVLNTEYDEVKFSFTDVFIAKKNGQYGLIKKGNQTVLDFEYENISYVEKADIIEATKDGIETDIIGNDLNVKLTGIISEINTEKGYMKIRVNNEYKYYNLKFEEKSAYDVLPTNTLYLSKKDGKYGYVDKDGKVVVDYKYDDATEQNNFGFAAVNKDGKWGSIDRNGNIVQDTTLNLENNVKIDFIGNWYLGEDLNMNYYCK